MLSTKTRASMQTLIMMRNREGNIFSTPSFPKDVSDSIILFAGRDYCDCDPNSDIGRLLRHIALGEETDAEAILLKNPELAIEPGNYESLKAASPYAFALAVFDPNMAKMVASFLHKIGAEKSKESIDNYYRPFIENMLDQQSYDFKPLFDVLKKSSITDVVAALQNKTATHVKNAVPITELDHALVKFRKDFAPGKRAGVLHCNL